MNVTNINKLNWGLLLVALACLFYVFYSGLKLMVSLWEMDEYSHGYMIPMVALFLIWQKERLIAAADKKYAWLGIPILLFAFILLLIGEFSAIYMFIQYGFIVALAGVIITFFGVNSALLIWGAIFYLVFMIPLPNILYKALSNELQLVSSQIGVAVIRLFDISVFLEGNVIDLGVYKLQVVEACSGLRYLFPLMSFGFLIAYIYRGPWWQKAILFLSTIPITVLMNSFRIGVIGITVEYWGIEMAEGFLHDFEGWVIFISCLAILLLEIFIFHRLAGHEGSLWDRLDLDTPDKLAGLGEFKSMNGSYLNNYIAVALIAVLTFIIPNLGGEREGFSPGDRKEFVEFPMFKDGWTGRSAIIADNVLEVLKPTDYLKADYVKSGKSSQINFYVAYYKQQLKGGSAIHSPRSCIPGAGWKISDLSVESLSDVMNQEGKPLKFNRFIISKDGTKQLVYFWIEQSGHNMTNEFLARWYLMKDSMFSKRTDGALVRIIGTVNDPLNIDKVDQDMQAFVREFYPELLNYLPDGNVVSK